MNTAIVLLVVLILFAPCEAQVEIDEIISEGFLMQDNISEEELQDKLDAYFENRIIWRKASCSEIDELPISVGLKERLVKFWGKRQMTTSWSDFAKRGGFNESEMKVIRFFIRLKTESPATGQIQIYLSMKEDIGRASVSKTLIKSRYETANGWFGGGVTETDADEPQVTDYINWTIRSPLLRERWRVIAGAYRVNWGRGLMMSSNLMGSRSTDPVQNITPEKTVLANYQGTDENRFLFGSAIEMRLKLLTVEAFFSRHFLDAVVEDGIVKNLRIDGLHVTESAQAAQDILRETVFGSSVQFGNEDRKFGVFAVRRQFPLPAEFQDMKRELTGFSAFHKIETSEYLLTGEVAKSIPGGWAFVQSFVRRVGSASLVVSARYFSPDFYALFGASSLTSSGVTKNESGINSGARFRLRRGWYLSGYVDYFRQIRANEPGVPLEKGNEIVAAFGRHFRKDNRFDIKIRRVCEWELLSGEPTIERFHVNAIGVYSLTEGVNLTGRLTHVRSQNVKIESGSAVGISVDLKLPKNQRISIGTTHFYAMSSDAKVYLYEPGIPLRFSMAMLTGTGFRYFAVFRKQVQDRFDFSIALKGQQSQTGTDAGWKNRAWLELQMLVDL
ncbi:MAG: hypothetical protein COT43_04280 [Candidatus Marinimicrobia bacterium CG08_land_8_20_14_0_20_45_22]|nr:MAG: hypothetical protein COT43_04280 [Candidatus Marinimicrobia bacterium CG08_land_8_20_14_0_20_45_22]